MQKKYFFIVLWLLSLVAPAQVGTWRNLPTTTEVRSLFPFGDEILLATNGGVLSIDATTETFHTGINGEQTDNLDVNIVYVDSDSLLWVGSRSTGPIIEVFDLHRGEKKQVEFVELDGISSFAQVGDSVYATYYDGLEGGLLLYRKGDPKIEYLDQFSNFPNLISVDLSTVGNVVHLGNRLAFTTNKNVLWVELDGTNLKDPLNWHVTNIPTGRSTISKMVSNGEYLYVAIDNAVYRYEYNILIHVLSATSEIVDLKVDPSVPSRLVYGTAFGLHEYNLESAAHNQLSAISGVQTIALSADNVWVGSNKSFLVRISDQGIETYSANRPRDHLFNRMVINNNGDLIGGAYNGISMHSEQGWRTILGSSVAGDFNVELYNWNEMITDTLAYRGNAVVEDMIKDQIGNIYLSLQGRGVLKADEMLTGESEFLTATDSVMEPTYDSDTYILSGQMAVDSKNNVWLTNKFTRDGHSSMTILDPGGDINHIYQYQDGMDSRTVKSIAIDKNDFVWAGSQVRAELQATGGIYFIDHQGTIGPNMELNVSYLSSSPLADNEILQLEVDSQNTLWILTPSGVQSMILPDRWLNSAELRNWAGLHMTSKSSEFYHYWQLTDYNVTGIEIDQRGNRWFLSSNAGVHVLQENGRWINDGYGFNTGNSELLDNTIYSIAFDAESGETYISTPKGVSVLTTAFANPKSDYSALHIYPQPFNPTIHNKVVIQGLMDNSSVKILTVAGVLVKELISDNQDVQGNEAQWDGRDSQGDGVGSGVYIVYIYNEDGVTSTQKMAVLR